MKIKNVILILLAITGILVLLFGVPIIINECYKANCGYITVWDGADVLGYYGTLLGAAIAVLTLVATIVFTKKQIQRDSFLRSETDKLSQLESIFLGILDGINPIETLKNVMDNGFSDKRITRLTDGLLKISLNASEMMAYPTIMSVTLQGTTYSVYIDPNSNTLKVRTD